MKLEGTNHEGEYYLSIYDVVTSLIGKEVVVLGNYTINGKLIAFNGYVLHVRNDSGSTTRDYYVTFHSVQAIAKLSENDLL